MPELRINLSEELDKKIEHYKVQHGLDSKADAAIQMLKELPFKVEIEGLPKIKKNGAKQ